MKQRLYEVNILRAMAALAVILVHTTAVSIFSETAGETTRLLFSLINRSLKFTTPTFIFISGVILFYNYHDRPIKYLSFWHKRLKSVLVPYFLWTIVYYYYFIYKGYENFSFDYFLDKLLHADMVYNLYFVLIITQFYLLFGIFRYVFTKFNSHLVILAFFIANVVFMKYVYFEYIDRFFMQYIFFFAFGCYFAKNYECMREKISRYKFLLGSVYLALCLLYTYQFYTDNFAVSFFGSFAVNMIWLIFSVFAILFYFYLADYLDKKNSGILRETLLKISDSSYYIYLAHPLMLYIAQDIAVDLAVPSTTINFLLMLLIVSCTVIPASYVYKSKKGYVRRLVKRFIRL